MNFSVPERANLAVIGLGYVGLPVALAFSRHYSVVGFDIQSTRIAELQQGYDVTQEIPSDVLQSANFITFTDDPAALRSCNVFIITVPTPVDAARQPDLSFLLAASQTVGRVLKSGDVVIYESTVYPGCTEEDCVPVLEAESGLRYNEDFFCGYSPERINPGDKTNTITKIRKVTSGSTSNVALFVDNLYNSVIEAGTYLAPSIRVAEAAKAIENAQRDVNISFVNELALIFDRLGLDTHDVLAAAGTKWNFLPYKPGLVGGHCIGVDPYYLAYKAESVGYSPQVILSGRRVNDYMGVFVANKLVKLLIQKGHAIESSRVLLLGITFKENCPDTRNSRVFDVLRELEEFGLTVDVHDPWASAEHVAREHNVALVNAPIGTYQAIVLAVAHRQFLAFPVAEHTVPNTVIYDLKAIWPRDIVDARL